MSPAEVWVIWREEGAYDEYSEELIEFRASRETAVAEALRIVKTYRGVEWTRTDTDYFTKWDGRRPGRERRPGNGLDDGGVVIRVEREEVLP